MAGMAQYPTVASGPVQVETTQVATPCKQAGSVPVKVLPNWHGIALQSNPSRGPETLPRTTIGFAIPGALAESPT